MTSPETNYQRRATLLRRGIVYHGTTRRQAEDILQNGFHLIPYEELLADILAKLGIDPKRLSRQKLKSIEFERCHYETAGTYGEPMISSAPSPEIASRWAGSGGEVARSIERIVTGRRLDWRDPRSPLSGEPVVLQLALNRAGREAANFRSYMESHNRIHARVQTGYVSAEDALETIRNQYVDIKLLPHQIGRVTILGTFTDQGCDYTNWLKRLKEESTF